MESSVPASTDYISIINRRRWSFVVPCAVVVVASMAICLYLPSIYKSTSKILVKKSEISSYYVKQSVTSYAEERVRSIQSIILDSKRLKDMIKKYRLYPDLQKTVSVDDIVSLIRRNTTIFNVTEDSDLLGTSESIVFALSYEDRDPHIAQQVAKLLTGMFLEENINIRKKQASETTAFLEKEMHKLEKELEVIEGRISSFKEKHINELPSLLQVNIQRLQGVELKREGLQEKLLNKKDILQDLKMRLALIPKSNSELTDRGKLVDLEAKLVNLRSQYSEAYPDVIRLKAELAELKEKIDAKSDEEESGQDYLYNPAHVTLSSQLSTVENEINSLQRQLEELDKNEIEYQKRIETTLRIEEDYADLVNKRKNTQKKYDDLMKKLLDAKVSRGLEEEQKGERFTLIQNANYPQAPYKPNRVAIILLGCFLGVGLGTGIVALQEYLDHSIRDGDMLSKLSVGPVLGSIPVIISGEDIARKQKNRLKAIVLVLLIVSGLFFTLIYYTSFSIVGVGEQLTERIKEVL